MIRQLTARTVDEISRTASVSDYDELPEDQQETVRRLAAGEAIGGGAGFDTDTAGYNFVEIFGTTGCRNSSGNYSRQYEQVPFSANETIR